MGDESEGGAWDNRTSTWDALSSAEQKQLAALGLTEAVATEEQLKKFIAARPPKEKKKKVGTLCPTPHMSTTFNAPSHVHRWSNPKR
jgi:hypothetical protein